MRSFPVPLSPVISTERLAPATRSNLMRTSLIAAVCPKMMDSGGSGCELAAPSKLTLAKDDIVAFSLGKTISSVLASDSQVHFNDQPWQCCKSLHNILVINTKQYA